MRLRKKKYPDPREDVCPRCGSKGTRTIGAFSPSGELLTTTRHPDEDPEGTLYGLICLVCSG